MFRRQYASVFEGGEEWDALPAEKSEIYEWEPDSTYIKAPPFFERLTPEAPALREIRGARALALLGDSVTTDHISPAGFIPADTPAGKYLIEKGVAPEDFNSYGSRRGNHEVMMRGTFANIRIQNALVPGTEGGVTRKFPEGRVTSIYEAAMEYAAQGTPCVVLAGREYGTGSSRDWAAKGPALLGVRAVIAESYERIHRSNLVGMGILPLQFEPGQSWRSLNLSGEEIFDLSVPREIAPGMRIRVRAERPDRSALDFETVARLDTQVDVDYWRHGGILAFVLRKMAR
jgi:aconitate hydratase